MPTDDLDPAHEWISLEHPKLTLPEGEPAPRQPREAFEAVWKDKGWREIKDSSSSEPFPTLVEPITSTTTAKN